MKNHKRERLFNPAAYLPGPLISPLPQDGASHPSWLGAVFMDSLLAILRVAATGA